MSIKNIKFVVKPGGSLSGDFTIPGDKSISHRSIMFGALANGVTEISGFLSGEDNLATLNAFRALGVDIEGPESGKVRITGVGLNGLRACDSELDLGNSGTAMRLMAGLMAAQSFDSTLVGDKSLSTRPMLRVTKPLTQMGAVISTEDNGTPPIAITGNQKLQSFDYDMPVASAQVKSCLLLAGLYSSGITCITEPAPTRDHTERMLQGFGYKVSRSGSKVCIEGGGSLTATNITVPGDISSAAFFMVGACIAADSDVTLKHVGINPTRIGIINILKMMGANISLLNEIEVGGEPVADIRIKSSKLNGIVIPEDQVPLAIDEFPVIFIAAACATGETILTGAKELRVKESDRIQAMADGLEILGIDAKPTDDGIKIKGGTIGGGEVNSDGDHRIAMAFSIAGLKASDDIYINDCANVATSFPDFVVLAQNAGLKLISH
ncbi:3-phosphoshikimate 1-carboxyvinyltransferase [hydrothermal vent metagenome]|uniref:3-phosphoshikimate 1-carboxyvinyltransferase n=1 Tax=hydrothermal vent metagenome TaxID=652676 RepID=A0A3B1A1J4_9ZZZZ